MLLLLLWAQPVFICGFKWGHMKDLLTKLRTRIATELPYLGGKKRVHIVPDEDILPLETDFPCVGLKDGGVENHYYVGGNRPILTVDIVGYVLLNDLEDSVMGKGNLKGILEIIEDLKTVLVQYDPTGYVNFLDDAVVEAASENMEYSGRLVQQKRISMAWRGT